MMCVCVCCYRSLRLHFLTEADFVRNAFGDDDCVSNNADSRIVGYFHTHPVTITQGQSFDLEETIATLNKHVDAFTCRGSGFVMTRVRKLTGVFVPFLPLGGSSYVPTPPSLYARRAIINVKNYEDRKCFKYAIISAMFPANKHSDLLSSYVQHLNAIDCSDLSFPVTPNQIPVFERNNPTIAVHCLAYNEGKRHFLFFTCRRKCTNVHIQSRCCCWIRGMAAVIMYG